MGDLNSRRGRIQGMDNKGGKTVVKAEVPMAEMLTYGTDLTSMTQGRGSFNMEMNHYDIVPGLRRRRSSRRRRRRAASEGRGRVDAFQPQILTRSKRETNPDSCLCIRRVQRLAYSAPETQTFPTSAGPVKITPSITPAH